MTNENFHLPFVFYYPTESRSVLWPCTTSEDCGKVPEARCSIYGFCQCPAGRVFSTDVTRCLLERSYGVACEEAVQCSHMLTGAKCEDKVCTCDTGFTYVRGRCRQLANIDQPCNDVSGLFFLSVIICNSLPTFVFGSISTVSSGTTVNPWSAGMVSANVHRVSTFEAQMSAGAKFPVSSFWKRFNAGVLIRIFPPCSWRFVPRKSGLCR